MNIFGKKAPKLCPSNPGHGTSFAIGYEDDGETYEERIDLVDLLAFALEKAGLEVKKNKDWIELRANRLQVVPHFVELEPYEDGSVRTVTTIQLNHPDYFPSGIFEYQHSNGADAIKSILFGFFEWYQQCLIPVMDSLLEQPENCQELKIPAGNGTSESIRKVTFGQPLLFTAAKQHDVPARELLDEEHDFCHCCLFSKNLDAFAPLLESNDYVCLLLFASRYPDGIIESDCRINGEDFPEGIQALNKYVSTWPGKGFEARKQFVVLS